MSPCACRGIERIKAKKGGYEAAKLSLNEVDIILRTVPCATVACICWDTRAEGSWTGKKKTVRKRILS